MSFSRTKPPKNTRGIGGWGYGEEVKMSSPLDALDDDFIKEVNDENSDTEIEKAFKSKEKENSQSKTQKQSEPSGRICYNCKKTIPEDDFDVHTIICCR